MKRNMKVKVENPAHSAIVQLALFKLGYYWNGSSETVDNTDAMYLFADDKYITYEDSDSVYFEENAYEEYFLVNGEFVTKDYWTAPETTYQPLPVENVPSITPRVEFLRQRVSEILAAMTRFNDLKMVPPSEWHLELEDIFEEIKNAN